MLVQLSMVHLISMKQCRACYTQLAMLQTRASSTAGKVAAGVLGFVCLLVMLQVPEGRCLTKQSA